MNGFFTAFNGLKRWKANSGTVTAYLTWRRALLLIAIASATLLLLSINNQLELPEPSGSYAVGRTALYWVDTSRPEVLTASPEDRREVVAQVWYPAEADTGVKSDYIPQLDHLAQGLRESGELSSFEVAGLKFVHTHGYWDADVADAVATYPVVLLSPGNGTNAEFYSGLADELASRGYIVVGLNHPYDVSAVALGNGQIASFAWEQWPIEMAKREEFTRQRVAVRTEDILFALYALEALDHGEQSILSGHLDLNRVVALGHSLGAIAAIQACQQDSRFTGCINLDGLYQGNPFSTEVSSDLPRQPFMFLTKEESLHPAQVARLEALASKSYWVTIRGASHDHFTDGPLLRPGLLPTPNQADRIHKAIRTYTLAFLNKVTSGTEAELLEETSDVTEARVIVYEP